MKITRSKIYEGLILLAILGFCFWLLLFSGWLFRSHARNEPNRQALVQLHQAIQLGASSTDVRDLFQQHATRQLKLNESNPDLWHVRMPMEFGATDWTLLLDFRDGKVTGVRLHTADGPPPKSGPPHKKHPPIVNLHSNHFDLKNRN
jgi:hypothetical protein